jgi:vitamin B12 transporter
MYRTKFNPARFRAGAILFALVSCIHARADDGSHAPYELTPSLVVTPARGEQQLEGLLDAVSVISREDIERSAAEDLPELLRLLPGIDVVRSGPAGSQTSVFIRGGNSNHVLVLIDGIRVSSANTGAYAWELLPVNQIERIEVVRGPKGSVYGSEAIGGVIQIFTRSRPEPYARLTAGSWGAREFAGGWGVESGATRISINGGYRETDGFSAQNPDGFSFDPDDDGLEAANLGINASRQLANGALRFSLLQADTETEFDQGKSDADQSLVSLRYRGAIAPDWQHELVGGYVHDRLRSDFGAFATGFRSERYDFAWQHEVSIAPRSMIRFGFDHSREAGEDQGSFDETRSNSGLYAGVEHSMARWLWQASARVDDNSEFGEELTGQLGLGFDLSEHWRLGATFGSGFRGPNLNEQFSPGFGGLFTGNPELEPESSESAEVSLRWTGENAALSVAVYRTSVDDLIVFAGPAFQAINIERARLQGMEFEYTLERGPWSIAANATFQDAEDRGSGRPLLRRPDEKGSLTVDRRFGKASWIGLEWYLSGRREDFGGISLASYQLVNLRAGWQLRPAWRLELRADNLLDENYEPAFGFNGAERSFFASVAWAP